MPPQAFAEGEAKRGAARNTVVNSSIMMTASSQPNLVRRRFTLEPAPTWLANQAEVSAQPELAVNFAGSLVQGHCLAGALVLHGQQNLHTNLPIRRPIHRDPSA